MKTPLAVALIAAGLTAAGCQANAPAPPGQPFPVVEAKARVLASRPAACPDRSRREPSQREGSQSEPRATVFRDAAAWADHLAALAPAGGAALADWRPDFAAGESVVLAEAGHLPNPGYRVTVPDASLAIRDGVLQVRLTAVAPPPDRVQAQVLTPACAYLRLDRADYREVALEVSG